MSNQENHLDNNRVGRLYRALNKLNQVGGNTTTRIAWFRYFFSEHERAEQVIPELDPEFHIKFGSFLSEIHKCRDIVRSIEGYSPRLYEKPFADIYEILRNSWENQGHPWVGVANQLAPHVVSLEHICDKVANTIGYTKLPSDQELNDLIEFIRTFSDSIESSDFDDEFKMRLKRCVVYSMNSVDKYRNFAVNDFYSAFEEIWKEILAYLIFGKNGTSESRKANVTQSGLDKILTRLAAIFGILNTGNTLLTQQNFETVLQLFHTPT